MRFSLVRGLGAGLLLATIGCGDSGDQGDNEPGTPGTNQPDPSSSGSNQPSGAGAAPSGDKPADDPSKATVPADHKDPGIPPAIYLPSLAPASDCSDLLAKIQDDAIAKLKMQVELYKKQPLTQGGVDGGVGTATGVGTSVSDGLNAGAGGAATSPVPSGAARPEASADSSKQSSASSDEASAPVGASETNAQVAGVDEADFVKVVEKGAEIFLLHGSTLQKIDSWPPEDTALAGKPLTIEGTPSEMFVSDEGKAVIFSSVYTYGYTAPNGKQVPVAGGIASDAICASGYCGGGTSSVKITVADVSGDTPKVERELYYEGWYVSSRRYAAGGGGVVRAVLQANSKYAGLYSPNIQWYDAWNRPYDQQEIASQLDQWQERTVASIRKTLLSDWLPTGKEVQSGKLVELQPACNSYFVPDPGLSDYGLTHVVSLDVAHPEQAVGGITIVGATSTVYSSADRLVLAQPDYRWGPVFAFGALSSPATDFGITNEQQTALHVFELTGTSTKYLASGWVFGSLPSHNPQFGIDVAADGTIRVATTGSVRNRADAKPEDTDFWQQHPENYVITSRAQGDKLEVVGKSPKLGHDNETVQSARFVEDRAYVVTFRQTDPLIVLDVANAAAPSVLGEIQIPGFSEYMHPLDARHLITFGQTGSGGSQLQLFDVTDPKAIPGPKTLPLGEGSSSEVSYNHKAFTFYQGHLAIPLWNNYYDGRRQSYGSALVVVKVDANSGFQRLGTIDHARLYADNGLGVKCGYCDQVSCYDYFCSYSPEVRRGHFVQGEDSTYVYSFSYAGVLVNDLANLTRPLASVGLPAPLYSSYQPWYGTDGLPVPQDAGVIGTPTPSSDGGMAVAVDAGVDKVP